jgi:hypothetical protein
MPLLFSGICLDLCVLVSFVLNQQFEYFALAVGKDELALVIDALQCSHPSLPG